jgi:C4-dicarboxylate transporter DctM subunit
MTAILLIIFFVLLLLRVPIAFCMLISSLAALLYAGINPIMAALEPTRSLSGFYAFLAVPFFILAGEIMTQGGLSAKLINFVKSFIGHKRCGLPLATVASSQLFGAVSGASAATCAAIGSIMIPPLEKNGYPRAFSSALAACAGTTGALIPPSIVLLIYGTVANLSIEKLFIAGIGPGILVGLALMTLLPGMSRKFNVVIEPKATVKEKVVSTYQSFWVILLMVIVLGGIMGGIFTTTEASSVAVVYALVISMLIYKQLKLRDLPKLFLSAAKTTAALSFLLACASLFAWTLSIGQLPIVIANAILSTSDSLIHFFATNLSPEVYFLTRKIVVLAILNIVLLIFSMFIDIAPGLLIVVPVLLPISAAIGMDSGLSAIHFGVLVVSNMTISLVTPPVGSTLFVAGGVGKVSVSQMLPYIFRFFAVMLVAQLLVTYVPFFTTFLPTLMG